MDLGEENCRSKVPFSSHHFEVMYNQHDLTTLDVDLEHLVKVLFIREMFFF